MSQAESNPDVFIPAAALHARPVFLATAERKLPYRLAMPLIGGLSLALWLLLWQLGALAVRLLLR